MAFTVSRKQSVFGNQRVVLMDVTTDGAEDNIDSGLDVIDAFSLGDKSITTSAFTLHENVDSSGTAANGTIGASGLTSGDEFFLIIYGR